jgi:hypothetical protein
MHANTKLLVIGLAIIAALLIGVNIGRQVSRQPASAPIPLALLSPTQKLLPTPTPKMTTYTNSVCGFKVAYSERWTIGDSSEQGTLFSEEKGSSAALIGCKPTFSRPQPPKDRIETVTIASVSGTLFHSDATDGSPTQLFVIKHPTKNEDIYVAGDGPEFKTLLQGISFIK